MRSCALNRTMQIINPKEQCNRRKYGLVIRVMKYILMRLFSSTKLYEIKNPSTEGTRNEHGNMRNMETN